MGCIKRFYCFIPPSPADDSYNDDYKDIITRGIKVVKKRKNSQNRVTPFGTLISGGSNKWITTEPYILPIQWVKDDKETSIGVDENYKDLLKFESHPDFDIKRQDFIIYQDQVFEIIKIDTKKFDEGLPTLLKYTGKKRNPDTRYFDD